MSEKKLISICIPVLNEAGNVNILVTKLMALCDEYSKKYDFELVFSDNDSDDETWSKIRELGLEEKRIKAIKFSKNVGFQRSIFMNYKFSLGDAVIQMDADLQDPVEMISEFIEKWEAGYDVIYGIRRDRDECKSMIFLRKLGYWTIDKLSVSSIPRDAGDFRLLDRRVVDTLLQYKSPDPYIRGIIATLGFNQLGVPYARVSRKSGNSKFGMTNLIKLGLSGIFEHSAIPLRLGTYLGTFALLLSGLLSTYYVYLKFSTPDLPQGLASLHILVLAGIGLISFLLGLIGEYLLKIYKILLGEPMAVVVEKINLEHRF